MPTYYVAGPMRGYDQFNFPAFDAARDALVAQGHTVLSPADMDREIGLDESANTLEGFDVQDALRRDFLAILQPDTDGIVLLPGWEDSEGAKAERFVAEKAGKRVYHYPPNDSTPMFECLTPSDRCIAAWDSKTGQVPAGLVEPTSDGVTMVTDPDTGGQKGAKSCRMDLIPAGPLWEVGEVYGMGARKYTRYGDCSCSAIAANQFTPRESAASTTRSRSSSVTQPTPSDNGQIVETGTAETSPRSAPTTGSITSRSEPLTPKDTSAATQHVATDSPTSSTRPSSLNPVVSAASGTRFDTLTTVTPPESSGERSVTDAISVSGSSTSEALTGPSGHLPGCGALTAVSSGEHNWRKGYAWSLSIAAALRHFIAWIGGERRDPTDGQHHLASVVFHCLALMEFETTNPAKDDRWTPEESDQAA